MIRFEKAFDRLERYIWHTSRKLAKYSYGTNKVTIAPGTDADDLFQMGVVKLLELTQDSRYYHKSVPEFDSIFKRSLYNQFMDLFQQFSLENKAVVLIDLDAESELWGFDAFVDVYLREYQTYLETVLSDDAATLLEVLLHPTPAIYHMHNIHRMRREALQLQGFKVHMPAQKLSQLLVGKTIGFNKNYTNRLLREIRDAWTNHFQTRSLGQSAVTP